MGFSVLAEVEVATPTAELEPLAGGQIAQVIVDVNKVVPFPSEMSVQVGKTVHTAVMFTRLAIQYQQALNVTGRFARRLY